MEKPKKHIREQERIQELQSLTILDTLPEEDYDTITTIASQICETGISLITLVDEDRQWFKSQKGLDNQTRETPRDYSFCAHALHEPSKIFTVEDTSKDERFKDNPLVTGFPHIAFYAGFPIFGRDNLPLGTLCVIDEKPKKLSEAQQNALMGLAKQVTNLLELRKNKLQLERQVQELEEKNRELENFAYTVAHDIKTPLNHISGISELIQDSLSEENQSMLRLIRESASKLSTMVDSLLVYSRSSRMGKAEKETFSFKSFLDQITMLVEDESTVITLHTEVEQIYAPKTALEQVLLNLITNAVKYNDKAQAEIAITLVEHENTYEFSIADNGMGIPKEQQKTIFKTFHIATEKDKYGRRGNGIGLASVRKIVRSLGGRISVSSTLGKGTTFNFNIQK